MNSIKFSRLPRARTTGRGAVSNPQGRFARESRESAEDGWPGEASDAGSLAGTDARRVPVALPTVVSEERAGRIITRNHSPDVFFDLSINPYRGCEHGCIYCYARPTHASLGMSPGLDFESKIVAKVDAAQRLRIELSSRSHQCSPINIGSVTDAYQPVERRLGLTRGIIEVLLERRHPFSVITKSSLVERDIDLLARAARLGICMVLVSITTLDEELARRWEPRAAAPWRRLETVRRMAEAGVPVGVLVAPIVPFVNDQGIEETLKAAVEAGASYASYTVLRLPNELQALFTDWLRDVFPDRAARILARLADLRGGGRLNDARFHSRMRGEGQWAELIRLRFSMARKRLGIDDERPALRCDLFSPMAPVGAIAEPSSQLALF